MQTFKLIAHMAAVAVSFTLLQPANAQIELRRGVLPYVQVSAMANSGSTNLSQGYLTDLQTDPNFVGDFQYIYNVASTILSGYTIVNRGGYFPENAGIPREQQLTVSEAVYHIFTLDNGNELVLFRSPTLDTAEYFIREPGSSVITDF